MDIFLLSAAKSLRPSEQQIHKIYNGTSGMVHMKQETFLR